MTLDMLNLVSRYPSANDETRVDASMLAIGGSAGRGLLTAKRLGAEAKGYFALGEGHFGVWLRDLAAREGLEAEFAVVSGASAQCSFVAISPDGSRSIFWAPQPQAPKDLIARARRDIGAQTVLYVDSTDPAYAAALLQHARERGGESVIDTGSFKPHAQNLLDVSDHIIAPEKFAAAITSTSEAAAALPLLLERHGAKAVVLTQGAQGGLYITRESRSVRRYEAPAVLAVDTCGAGDVFHGAYAAGLAKGLSVEAAIDLAAETSARKVTALGNAAI